MFLVVRQKVGATAGVAESHPPKSQASHANRHEIMISPARRSADDWGGISVVPLRGVMDSEAEVIGFRTSRFDSSVAFGGFQICTCAQLSSQKRAKSSVSCKSVLLRSASEDLEAPWCTACAIALAVAFPGSIAMAVTHSLGETKADQKKNKKNIT